MPKRNFENPAVSTFEGLGPCPIYCLRQQS
jgi:hypothetical protein